MDIGGATPHETVLSTYGALKAVETQLATFDDGLAGALEKAAASIVGGCEVPAGVYRIRGV